MGLLIIFVWMLAAVMFFSNMSGFVLGHTYDYLNRCKTHHGSKALGWFLVLLVMYYIPWVRWGWL